MEQYGKKTAAIKILQYQNIPTSKEELINVMIFSLIAVERPE
jgi:hypothetical protein